jgi:hypothetical protein
VAPLFSLTSEAEFRAKILAGPTAKNLTFIKAKLFLLAFTLPASRDPIL